MCVCVCVCVSCADCASSCCSYYRIPNWRALSQEDDLALAESGFNRVTDTCIPEEQVTGATLV